MHAPLYGHDPSLRPGAAASTLYRLRRSVLQQRHELALGVQSHDGVAAADVLAVDEDVGHRALARDVQQQRLDGGAVVPRVQLHDLVLGVQHVQRALDARAVRAVGLGEHEHLLLGDGVLQRVGYLSN
ncbi:hypothetical protein ON010_g14382 [Phytophthora cinnamomi]|nr:hypothetical protein ON010_g14382 [Phytophthora cinnamomi]